MKGIIFGILFVLIIDVCAAGEKGESPHVMNQIAEKYVKLVLGVGKYDPDYVDAYYGPEKWKDEAKAESRSLEEIKKEASSLIAELKAIDLSASDEILQLRHQYLLKQLEAMAARVEMLEGKKLSFDEESKALYDAVAPSLPESRFQGILDQIGELLPGEGSLASRYVGFRKDFVIPKEKLDVVFTAAIDECRKRTKEHIVLPENENFKIEYVKDKAWAAYNWYQGNGQSLIQVNLSLPIYIGGALDLACHEGYPGHHVYNALLEEQMVKKRKWVEFTIYPLFSPQSLIAEGTANYGLETAFSGGERIAFEREVLFPLAGIDPEKAEKYYKVEELVERLDSSGNEAARRYINGEMGPGDAAKWLEKYLLMSPDRAKQRLRFIDQYRSYVINYNLGKDMVRKYIESKGGTSDNPQKRWQEFARLISSPRLPSGLK